MESVDHVGNTVREMQDSGDARDRVRVTGVEKPSRFGLIEDDQLEATGM